MAQELPAHKKVLRSSVIFTRHVDRITALLFDCALQSVTVTPPNGGNFDINHTNTRYILVSNYRLRLINLLKVLDGVIDIEVITRSEAAISISNRVTLVSKNFFSSSPSGASSSAGSLRLAISLLANTAHTAHVIFFSNIIYVLANGMHIRNV